MGSSPLVYNVRNATSGRDQVTFRFLFRFCVIAANEESRASTRDMEPDSAADLVVLQSEAGPANSHHVGWHLKIMFVTYHAWRTM